VQRKGRGMAKRGRAMPDTLQADALLVNLPTCAARLAISERQLRRLILSGHFGPQVIRLGRRAVRVNDAELEAWARAGCPARTRWTWAPMESCR
jgi:predicted DNA-binding transcriptional regulator AlpA